MLRPAKRRNIRLETLESRELMTSGGPSAEAQYMLYEINQARMNPAAMAQQVISNLSGDDQATLNYFSVNLGQFQSDLNSSQARPPVGWSDTLAATATQQSQDQANMGVQTHQGANGSGLGDRLDGAGYTNRVSDGENAYAYSKSVDHAMEAFLIDWGVSSQGHRRNLLQPDASPGQFYREVGIGIVNTNRPNFGPKVITQDFARKADSKAELVGVAFNDKNGNGAYNMDEGQGNVTVTATNEANGQSQSVQTWDAGGYQLSLDPGTYKVTASVGGSVFRTQDVTIGDQNVEVDFNLSQAWQGGSDVAAPVSAPVQATAAPVAAAMVIAPPTPAPVAAPAAVAAVAPTPTPTPTPTPVVVTNLQPSTPAPGMVPAKPAPASWGSNWMSWTAQKLGL